MEIDPDLVLPNKDLSLAEGAVAPWKGNGDNGGRGSSGGQSTSAGYYGQLLRTVAQAWDIPWRAPIRSLSQAQVNRLLYGGGDEPILIRYRSYQGQQRQHLTQFEGVIHNLQRRYQETASDYQRSRIEEFMSTRPCPVCHGARLKPETLAVAVAGMGIDQVAAMPVTDLLEWIRCLTGKSDCWPQARPGTTDPDVADGDGTTAFKTEPRYPAQVRALSQREMLIGERILKEIQDRLTFMVNVGLDYLTLNRSATTLAGGEAQRIRLATQIGSRLMGVLYVLDEPSIGLHQRDNERLIHTLLEMRDLGNTLLVVEHDEATIRAADWIIDLGPGAGEHGGEIVAAGTPEQITQGPQLDHRRLPVRPGQHPHPNGPACGQRPGARGARGEGKQPQGHRHSCPAREIRVYHRRVWLRQEHLSGRGALQADGPDRVQIQAKTGRAPGHRGL